MKSLLILFTLLQSFCSHANEVESGCENLNLFIPYKAGVQAEKQQLNQQAFAIYCQLAFKGDYRAQFKLAKYYYHGIENFLEQDLQTAYLWAVLSNSYVVSSNRTKLTEKIYSLFNEREKSELVVLANNFVNLIPSGNRIDMEYKPIDYQKLIKLNKEKLKPKKQTWTNIKK